jgi:hypothetical protein
MTTTEKFMNYEEIKKINELIKEKWNNIQKFKVKIEKEMKKLELHLENQLIFILTKIKSNKKQIAYIQHASFIEDTNLLYQENTVYDTENKNNIKQAFFIYDEIYTIYEQLKTQNDVKKLKYNIQKEIKKLGETIKHQLTFLISKLVINKRQKEYILSDNTTKDLVYKKDMYDDY